jgi:hypothetical protein
MKLLEGSIHSWAELSRQFVSNFAETYTRLGVENDLHNVVQRPNESLRQFIQCLSQVRNTIPRVSPAIVIATFRHGVKNKRLVSKMATHQVELVVELFTLANKVAREEAQDLVRGRRMTPRGARVSAPVGVKVLGACGGEWCGSWGVGQLHV